MFLNGVQFEEGLNYTCDRRHSTDVLSYNALFKYGIIKNLELRYNFDYATNETTDKSFDPEQTTVVGGVSAPNVGLKYSFLREKEGWMPNLTLSAHSQFDWYGREEFKPQNANANFRMTVGKTIVGNWYGIVGLGTNIEDGNQDATGQYYVVQTGDTFAPKLTRIAEIYGARNYKIDLNQNAVNGALVYLLNDNHQVDISAGKGLSDNWYGLYVALGYSFRLKT